MRISLLFLMACGGGDLPDDDPTTGDTDPTTPEVPCDDTDDDGVCDDDDLCPGFDDLADSDGDSVADGCDPCPNDAPDDSDGDGVCDSDDLCEGNDATGDTDEDGICDSSDACPGQDDSLDGDGDGIPDGCDWSCLMTALDIVMWIDVDYNQDMEAGGYVDCSVVFVGTGSTLDSCNFQRATFYGTWEQDMVLSTCDDTYLGDVLLHDETTWTPNLTNAAYHTIFFSLAADQVEEWHAHSDPLPTGNPDDSVIYDSLISPFDPAPVEPTFFFQIFQIILNVGTVSTRVDGTFKK